MPEPKPLLPSLALRARSELTVILLLAAGSAVAQDNKAKKQAEVRKATQDALARFYKADPKLKDALAKSPGYAVFTAIGVSFIFGGAGGKGRWRSRSSSATSPSPR